MRQEMGRYRLERWARILGRTATLEDLGEAERLGEYIMDDEGHKALIRDGILVQEIVTVEYRPLHTPLGKGSV